MLTPAEIRALPPQERWGAYAKASRERLQKMRPLQLAFDFRELDDDEAVECETCDDDKTVDCEDCNGNSDDCDTCDGTGFATCPDCAP